MASTVNTYRIVAGTGPILILNGTGILGQNTVASTSLPFNNAIISNDEAGEGYLALGTNAIKGQGILLTKTKNPFVIDKRLNPMQAPIYYVGTSPIQALAIQTW